MITQKRLDDKDLEGLPGVGPATKNQLYKIGIRRISDLILFLPSFLIDKTQLTDIISVTSGDQYNKNKRLQAKPNTKCRYRRLHYTDKIYP